MFLEKVNLTDYLAKMYSIHQVKLLRKQNLTGFTFVRYMKHK